jgi:curved DNA-binding protein CbpA
MTLTAQTRQTGANAIVSFNRPNHEAHNEITLETETLPTADSKKSETKSEAVNDPQTAEREQKLAEALAQAELIRRIASSSGEYNLTTEQAAAVLNVNTNATQKEIRKAYRGLVTTIHPDVHSATSTAEQEINLNEAFKLVSISHEILTGVRAPAPSRQKTEERSYQSESSSSSNRYHSGSESYSRASKGTYSAEYDPFDFSSYDFGKHHRGNGVRERADNFAAAYSYTNYQTPISPLDNYLESYFGRMQGKHLALLINSFLEKEEPSVNKLCENIDKYLDNTFSTIINRYINNTDTRKMAFMKQLESVFAALDTETLAKTLGLLVKRRLISFKQAINWSNTHEGNL